MKNKKNTYGLCIAATCFILDQLCKWVMLDVIRIGERPPIEVLPIFKLVMVWNEGISFGMLSNHNMPILLSIGALVIVGMLIMWLKRNDSTFIAIALGLVIGGALGNVMDRLRLGAVADFFYFHWNELYWPAFNIADSTIFIGVVLLCWHSMFIEPRNTTKGSKDESDGR